MQYSFFGVAGYPQPLEVFSLHAPGLAAALSGESDQLVITILTGLEFVERLGAFPIRGNRGQKPTFTPT